MPAALRLGLVLAIAFVCGMALWGGQSAHASGADGTIAAGARAPAPSQRPTIAQALPVGAERELLRALCAMAPTDQRAALLVAEAVTPSVLLARSVAPAAISHGRGVVVGELEPALQGLVLRWLEHVACLAAQERSDGRPPWPVQPTAEFSFAIAGDLRGDGPLYVRLHDRGFAGEWVSRPGGQTHVRWRDFAADAGQPWLREVLAPALPR